MRADMAKVIVERPRYGSRMRGAGKGSRRARGRIPDSELPSREGIKRSLGSDRKSLNEHLGPLRRFLEKQIGRPWNKVFAEICLNLSRDSAVQDHVRDHVADFVATKVAVINGVLHNTTRWGQPVPLLQTWRRLRLYVCPTTGILKSLRRKSRRDAMCQHESPTLHVGVDHDTALIRKEGVWYHVRFETFPKVIHNNQHVIPLAIPDVWQKTALTRAQAVELYGRAWIAKEVRPATRGEIRKHGEPLPAPHRIRR